MSTRNRFRGEVDLSGKPKETFENVFFRWAINVGKTVIVLTQLIALGALFYRFFVDRQIVDQRDEISDKEFLVRAQAGREAEFEGIHARLDLAKQATNDAQTKLAVMDLVRSISLAGSFQSPTISISKDSIILEATVSSIFSLDELLTEVENLPEVVAISVDEITSVRSGIRFKVSISLTEEVADL